MAMPDKESVGPPARPRLVRWAWLWMVLTPVGLAAVIFLGFLGGGGDIATGPALAGALPGLTALAAPTTAVIVAAAAAGAGERHARGTVVAAMGLLVATAVLLPVVAISPLGWAVAAAITAVVLVVALSRLARGRRAPSTRNR